MTYQVIIGKKILLLFSQTIHAIFPIAFLFSKELDIWKGFLLEKDEEASLSYPVFKGILNTALQNCFFPVFYPPIYTISKDLVYT